MVSNAGQRSEWARGWTVVLAGACGAMLSGLHTTAISTVMAHLNAAYGWSRAQVSASVMIVSMIVFIIGPFMGSLIDRVGPRRIALIGVPCYSLALAAVGLTGPGIWSWYLAWGVAGLAYTMISAVVWALGVSRCFMRQRGLALAVALSGTGIAGIVAPLVAVGAMDLLSWRWAFFLFGLAGLALILPVVWWLFHPDPAPGERGSAAVGPAGPSGLTRRELFASRRFWQMFGSVALVGAGCGVLVMHFQPMLRDRGLSAETAAGIASLMGLCMIAGRLAGGALLDHLPAHRVAAACFVLPALSSAILLSPVHAVPAYVLVIALVGFSFGAEGDILAYLTVRYFGFRVSGLAYSLMFGMFSMCFGTSPVVAGWAFDVLGDYRTILILVLAMVLVGSLATLLLGEPPRHGPANQTLHA